MFAGCLKGPAVCIRSRHRFALGGMVWLQNEIHADKALHHFINQMCVCCELDLGDFFYHCATKGNIFMLSNANE